MSLTKRPQRPEPFVASSTARRKVRGSIWRILRVASTWEARALMSLRISGGGKAVDVHEPGDTEVQISVIAGGWWRLPGAARSNS